MEKARIYSEESDMLSELGYLGKIIEEMHSKQNEIINWINEHEKAKKGKEFVDSGGKITDEGWKVLEEREWEQAKGGEHDPK